MQLILTGLLLAIGVNFLSSRNSSRTKAIKKLLLILTIPTAIFIVLFPSTSTRIANTLGVGRGADLLIYGLSIMVIFQIFDNYFKSRADQKRIVKLVRRLAILEANTKQRKSRK